jgi:hypothetical protein
MLSLLVGEKDGKAAVEYETMGGPKTLPMGIQNLKSTKKRIKSSTRTSI